MSSFKAGKNGSYKGPTKAASLSRQALNVTQTDAVGVAEGISARSGFNGEDEGPMADYERDPLTGNATERGEGMPNESIKSKGVDFTLC